MNFRLRRARTNKLKFFCWLFSIFSCDLICIIYLIFNYLHLFWFYLFVPFIATVPCTLNFTLVTWHTFYSVFPLSRIRVCLNIFSTSFPLLWFRRDLTISPPRSLGHGNEANSCKIAEASLNLVSKSQFLIDHLTPTIQFYWHKDGLFSPGSDVMDLYFLSSPCRLLATKPIWQIMYRGHKIRRKYEQNDFPVLSTSCIFC